VKQWDIVVDARFGSDAPGWVTVVDTEAVQVVWVALKRGQRFRWEPPGACLLQVWSGRVAVHVDGATVNVSAGQSLSFPEGARATVTGLSEAVVQTVAPKGPVHAW
jgi:quercetin dioxygenase-like cupin family protein